MQIKPVSCIFGKLFAGLFLALAFATTGAQAQDSTSASGSTMAMPGKEITFTSWVRAIYAQPDAWLCAAV